MRLRISDVGESAQTEAVLTLGMPTPIGRIFLAATPHALIRVELPSARAELRMNVWLALHFPAAPKRSGVTPILKKASHQIEDYFTGGLREFALPLELWGTPFQTTVWKEVAKVRAGETRTYAEIAAGIGKPSAVRAVAAAQSANPLPIVIPCHRIIGAGGRLAGYSGGLAAKQWLLDHEAAQSDRDHGKLAIRKPRRPVVGPIARPPSSPIRA